MMHITQLLTLGLTALLLSSAVAEPAFEIPDARLGPERKRDSGMESRWVEELVSDNPLPEYPRPTMVREQWLNLNGQWDFLSNGPKPPTVPSNYPERALVPSATQAATSCLEKEVHRGWYRKTIEIPQDWAGQKIVLHADAVGTRSRVYFNGKELGVHEGGFERISHELPGCTPGKQHEVVIYFDDTDARMPRGKPSHVSGIWQTVWLEPVPDDYIVSYRQTPDIDNAQLVLEIHAADPSLTVSATALDQGNPVATAEGTASSSFALEIPDQKLWSPESPFLYDLLLELKKDGKVVDRVQAYFGMRKISTGEVDGQPRIFLNNEVYYQTGLLDQGTWPDSFYTQPSDKCLEFEIQTAKDMGFNVLRKHVKIEAERWYYWCDTIGMLVWQDAPCQALYSGKLHENEAAKQIQRDALRDMMNQFYNHPSIITWCIFNEGGGQFEPRQMTTLARRLDGSRLIDTTSHIWPNELGRERYNADFYDGHCYERGALRFYDNDNAHIPTTLGEWGGIGYEIDGHTLTVDVPGRNKPWGYGPMAKSEDELLSEYEKLIRIAAAMRKTHNLCAIIYTELTDFYKEVNGFITFDRKVIKVDTERLRKINAIFREFDPNDMDSLDVPRPAPKPAFAKPVLTTKKVSMPATKGRFVRIELPGNERILSLAEVEVTEGGKNIALKQKATASSAVYGGVPERAVDGNTDGNFANASVTHTMEPSANPWWEVDLGRTFDIEKIRVFNRADFLGQRLNGFMLKILDEKRQVVFSTEVSKAQTIHLFGK